MKLPKALIRIGLALMVLVTAVLAVRGVLQITEGRKLSRALADLKAKGVPLTVQELIPPCPDTENGAALWRAAEELYAFEGRDTKLFNDVYRKLHSGPPITSAEWAAISEVVEKNRRTLDLIPDVAAKPRFQYGDRDLVFYERRIPDAIKMIRAVRLWGFESMRIAEKGDLRRSLDRLRTGLRFAPKSAEESSLIAYLIALANARTCLLFLNRTLSGREAGEEILLPLFHDLDGGRIGRWKSLLGRAFQGERVQLLDIGLPATPKGLQKAFGGRAWWIQLYYWLIGPLVKRDIRLNLPRLAELEELAPSSYFETNNFWKLYEERVDDLPWYAIVSKLAIIKNMEATFLKVAVFDALILSCRAGLACRIYKGRTGEYPENLEALVPALLDAVPIDPFTGKPLVYRRDGEGFIVYSLGSNLKDDGGRSTWEFSQLVMDKDDDWTWKEDR